MQQNHKFTDMNNAPVYRETTQPLKPLPCVASKPVAHKQRRDKSDLGENFIAPDGGWAWVVCLAAGFSNLSVYPCMQQFGFIFRERLLNLNMSTSQVTTIINTCPAISACTGLLNGPMFRRFTFRQVGIVGSLLVFSGIMMSAFCETFTSYIIFYSILFGFGMGISVSSSSLAINTYFKQKRRKAAGFSWTITGFGPIIFPYVATMLMGIYGIQGTIFVFAAIALHSLVCALIYQPVKYHTKPPVNAIAADQTDLSSPSNLNLESDFLCKFCEQKHCSKKIGIFSSQFLHQDDDEEIPGFEIIEPGTPMLSRANDGYFGSKISLSSNRGRLRQISCSKDVEHNRKLRRDFSLEEQSEDKFYKPNYFNRERRETLNESSEQSAANRCTCSEERQLVQQKTPVAQKHDSDDDDDDDNVYREQLSFFQKVVTFFDLDLLRDITFVNLVAGLTIINFGEINFSILTPFILHDFGFTTSQTTLAVSMMACTDITMRFLVPFLTSKISWDNRVFFLIGVMGIVVGRTIVACTRSVPIIQGTFVWIGVCKGIRTIFWSLIIPGYVPLKRLPAASGLQLLISGLFTMITGPFVGLIRDSWDYSVTLHCLNGMTCLAAFLWTFEALVRRMLQRQKN